MDITKTIHNLIHVYKYDNHWDKHILYKYINIIQINQKNLSEI